MKKKEAVMQKHIKEKSIREEKDKGEPVFGIETRGRVRMKKTGHHMR